MHNSGDETIGGTKTFTNPIKGTIDGITYRYSAQGDDLNTSYMNDSVIFTGGNAVAHAPAGTDGTWAIIRNYNSNATNGAQSYYDTNTGALYVRTRNSTSTYTSWIQVADDSKVVHTADMRKPASDVVGIEDVPQAIVKPALASGVDLNTVVTPGVYPFAGISFTNYIDNGIYWGYLVVTSEGNIVTQTIHATGPVGPELPSYRIMSGNPAGWTRWERMANDYAVAHLSGANNFDTVPTVNNNQLLLASSLPADLARLSQDANFTAKLQQNGQDVALANNTIARNPDTGSISETNTFTAAQTFSIAPVINDASTSKGDNQAATMADLKSVENSAWHTVTLPDSQGLKSITMIYKIHDDEKYIEANIYAQTIQSGKTSPTMLNLSGIINKITSLDLIFISNVTNIFMINGNTQGGALPSFSSNVISLAGNAYIYTDPGFISITSDANLNFAKIYYDSLGTV